MGWVENEVQSGLLYLHDPKFVTRNATLRNELLDVRQRVTRLQQTSMRYRRTGPVPPEWPQTRRPRDGEFAVTCNLDPRTYFGRAS